MGREGGRGLPAQAAVRPRLVSFVSPQVEDDSCFGHAQEKLSVQRLFSLAAVKALHIYIYPFPQGLAF
jgi:hypothetical protein